MLNRQEVSITSKLDIQCSLFSVIYGKKTPNKEHRMMNFEDFGSRDYFISLSIRRASSTCFVAWDCESKTYNTVPVLSTT